MLRITTIEEEGLPVLLKLEGKLLTPWIGELEEACRRAGEPSLETRLDLTGLSFMDEAGTMALRELIRRGVRLAGCSPLVTELLKEND